MNKTINKCLHALGALTLSVFIGSANAALLGVQPTYPNIFYDNTGITNYNNGTQEFNVDADPLTLKFTAIDPDNVIVNPRSVTIRIMVDAGCGVSGVNPSGFDLEVIGDVYDAGFNLIKTGVLLTGDIVDMGEMTATTTTSVFDFRFTNAGGLLVTDGDWPMGQDIGVVLTSENSNFADDCVVSFNGGAKGNIGPIDPEAPAGTPTGTQGYWKNHLSAWPIDPVTVGGVTRSAADANNLMRRPPKGDKTWSMYRQLTAAVLNLANGSDPTCIQDTIDQANQWLIDNPLGSGVKSNSSAWQDMGDGLHETLDAYNNGNLCAPHRDD